MREGAQIDALDQGLTAAGADWPATLFGEAAHAVVADTLTPGPARAYAVCGYLHLTFPRLHPDDEYTPELTGVSMHDLEVTYLGLPH